jgi:hypothetical protein
MTLEILNGMTEADKKEHCIKKFIEYFNSFYSIEGIYPIDGLKDSDIREAIEIRAEELPDLDFDGDTIDRELVRDIILRKGYKINY